MSGNAFVDTNILVYARDAGAGDKQVRAESLIRALWESRRGRVSVQVLNEYFVVVTQKSKPGLAPDVAWDDVVALRAWEPAIMDWALLEKGRKLHREGGLSWRDALIVVAAQSLHCEVLYTEDLSHGQVFGEVHIVNPFA